VAEAIAWIQDDRVETPLQVVALDNHASLMGMWEPYAALRYLRKPVDLTIIQTASMS